LKGDLGASAIDSRGLKAGELFWALQGEHSNGHEFVGSALENGAQAVVVREDWFLQNGSRFPQAAFIIVADPLKALQELARRHRQRFAIPVFALTGSNGKTTTKEMVAAALGRRFRVVKSQGNFNNHIGVPLTLLQMDDAAQFVVLEMGTNHPGEIRFLCSIAQPTAGLVLNVSPAHLEGFGSVENIAREKGALYESLRDSGVAFFNFDDPWVAKMSTPAKIQIGYSFAETTENRFAKLITARKLDLTEDGYAGLKIGKATIRLNLPGLAPLSIALAAVAVADHFGVPMPSIAEALSTLPPVKGRMNVQRAGGILVIDDTYNANTASTQAALDFLASLQVKGRRIAVLGDHLELGAASESEHRKIGKMLLAPALSGAILIGDQMRHAWAEFSGCGKMAVYYDYPEDYDDIVDILLKILRPGDAILIKGSRGMRLEKISDGLLRGLEPALMATEVA
jgi:UDP-N-acetylmuramoyl-tripeptide--D-alanyl-D-alanine ligase